MFLTLINIVTCNYGQIIADHTVVDKFDDIPAEYINELKEMWLVYAGESHSEAIRTGLALLESALPAYAVNVVESGTPDAYTTTNLRVSRGTWGDLNNSSGWIYDYGEEDWWTNATAITRTKAGISYCNSNNLTIGALGFGWCWDAHGLTPTPSTDPVYGVHWYGSSKGGPSGDKYWGIDDGDFSLTSNPVNMDTYLSATQGYIDYCKTNNIPTKVFFTTGPVDDYSDYFGLETMYQATLKYQHIRNYVLADAGRILFDYADILCYDDNGTPTTATWNGHTFPFITNANLGDASIGHIGSTGAIRLAKAMWWMLARMAGWDGGDSSIPVTSITVTSNDGSSTINSLNGTLQLSATIAPTNATNKTVTWSIINGTGQATISATGLVTALANGSVTAIASANDGSDVSGTIDILINFSDAIYDHLNITISQNEVMFQLLDETYFNSKMSIYDMLGHLVFNRLIDNNIISINNQQLHSGIYIAVISNGSVEIAIKFIISK